MRHYHTQLFTSAPDVPVETLKSLARTAQYEMVVARNFQGWNNFDHVTDGSALTGDMLLAWQTFRKHGDQIDSWLRGWHLKDSERQLEAAFYFGLIGIAQLIVETPPRPIQVDSEHYQDIAESARNKFFKTRSAANAMFILQSSAKTSFDITWHAFLVRALGSLHGALVFQPRRLSPKTRVQYQIKQGEQAWFASQPGINKSEAKRDAAITDQKCPQCGQPCPSYRLTCEHCGLVISTRNP